MSYVGVIFVPIAFLLPVKAFIERNVLFSSIHLNELYKIFKKYIS